jgi:phage shock protein C
MEKRLYRNTGNRMLGGVCTGLAEYFSIDPVLIRLLFVIFTLHHGIGIVAYIILWIVVPARAVSVAADTPDGGLALDDVADGTFAPPAARHGKASGRSSYIGGIALIVIGVLFLFDNFIPGFGFHEFWPVLLIAVGGALLWNSSSRKSNEENPEVVS